MPLINWTVAYLHPTSLNAIESVATSVEGRRQVGFIRKSINWNTRRAVEWISSASSLRSKHPANSVSSEALCIRDQTVVGWVKSGNVPRAFRWRTLASGDELASTASEAHAHDNGSSGGILDSDAYLWDSPDGSVVLHHEADGQQHGMSVVYGMHDERRVGTVWSLSGGHRAYLWMGSPSSARVLHPFWASSSEAWGVFGNRQVGSVDYRAALWRDSSNNLTELHPPGAAISGARGVHGGYQVGYASFGKERIAGIWTDTAESWQSLHALLPPHFSLSQANGVWTEGNRISVVGYGVNSQTSRTEALLWRGKLVNGPLPRTRAVPPPGPATRQRRKKLNRSNGV